MAFKFVAILAVLAVAGAVPVQVAYQAAPAYYHTPAVVKTVAAPVYKQVAYEHEAPAEYEFNYSVHDEHTGDIKSQQETRKGNAVQGFYELIDSDGHKRVVHYTADEHTGFNAVVERHPVNFKVPVPAPVAHAPAAPHYAPAAPHYAPVHYAPAPAKLTYAAPVAKVIAPVAKFVTPVAKLAAPVAHYAAPVAHYAAPVAHYAAPVYHH